MHINLSKTCCLPALCFGSWNGRVNKEKIVIIAELSYNYETLPLLCLILVIHLFRALFFFRGTCSVNWSIIVEIVFWSAAQSSLVPLPVGTISVTHRNENTRKQWMSNWLTIGHQRSLYTSKLSRGHKWNYSRRSNAQRILHVQGLRMVWTTKGPL